MLRPHLLLPIFLGLLLAPLAVSGRSGGQAPAPRPAYKNPLGVAVDHSGNYAYVALQGADALAVVDLKRRQVVREVPVGKRPGEVNLTTGPVYVRGEDGVTEVDRHTWESRPVANPTVMFVPAGLAPIPPLPPKGFGGFGGGFGGFGGTPQIEVKRWAWSRSPVASGPVFLNGFNFHRGGFNGGGFGSGGFNGYGSGFGFAAQAVVLDERTRGFADPSDAAWRESSFTHQGPSLAFLIAAGSDAVVALDVGKMTAYVNGKGSHLLGKDPHADPAFLAELAAPHDLITTRLPTQANPRRLALSGDGRTLVVSNHLADSLTVIDAVQLTVVGHVPFSGPAPDAARRGEILFHSASLSPSGRFSCASCHPGGGGDGLTWDLSADGKGPFRRTKSLGGVKETGPYGWHGEFATLAERVRHTLLTEHKHTPKGTEVEDLVTYLESLPAPEPRAPRAEERASWARGKAVFEDKGRCARCHKGESRQDGRSHDIGTAAAGDRRLALDTPSLRGLGRPAGPFLHHGQAARLEWVFSEPLNPGQRHGAAHALEPQELADLMTYLKSL